MSKEQEDESSPLSADLWCIKWLSYEQICVRVVADMLMSIIVGGFVLRYVLFIVYY